MYIYSFSHHRLVRKSRLRRRSCVVRPWDHPAIKSFYIHQDSFWNLSTLSYRMKLSLSENELEGKPVRNHGNDEEGEEQGDLWNGLDDPEQSEA